MSKFTVSELGKILKEHKKWIDTDEEEGEEANLSGANLSRVNLSRANLRFANLKGADLSNANLENADLIEVDLYRANLNGADLRGAKLWFADLRGADLRDAILSEADLSGANLIRVRGLTLEQLSSVGTLCDAELSAERIKQVSKKYPHLLEEIEPTSYKTLSLSEVQSMSNVSIRKKDDWGFYGHSTINHDYSLKAIKGDKVVVDNTTGLMWHQSGSDTMMQWGIAFLSFGSNPASYMKWIRKLNKSAYAGYQDWRLPTVDEAASLLVSSKKNGDLYIDPVFSKKQRWIWTGDKSETEDGSEVAWGVMFDDGNVHRSNHMISFGKGYCVRPVRSVLNTDSDEEPVGEVYEEEVLEEEEHEELEEDEELCEPKIITLRSSYKTLSLDEVDSMPNVSISGVDEDGFHGHSTINHDYSLKAVSGDVVVVDSATDLMWHQSGSDYISWDDAKEWVEDLNSEGYAGYNDWRLPTVDEAVSLLESSEKNGDLCIDPVFSKKQDWIWTGDMKDGSDQEDTAEDEEGYGLEATWYVGFENGGGMSWGYDGNRNYVRPVRSVE